MIDLNIRGFFDNLDHALLLKAVDHLHPAPWVRLCIVRWLKAEIIFPDGHRHSPEKGTPQGGVISPLLANLFLHYTQYKWLEKHYPNNSWERYADDSIIHCRSRREAGLLLCQLRKRMTACGLELHPEKTRIVSYTVTAQPRRGFTRNIGNVPSLVHYRIKTKGWLMLCSVHSY